MLKIIITIILVIFEIGITKIYNSYSMILSGDLAVKQFNNSNLDFIIQQNGITSINSIVYGFQLLIFILIIFIWKTNLKNMYQNFKTTEKQ